MAFGAKLASYRKQSGIKQDEFADLLWMNRSHLNEIEREKVNPPRLETILLMVGILNLNSEEAMNLLFEIRGLHGTESLVDIERLVKSLEAFVTAANAIGPMMARLKRALNAAAERFHTELEV